MLALEQIVVAMMRIADEVGSLMGPQIKEHVVDAFQMVDRSRVQHRLELVALVKIGKMARANAEPQIHGGGSRDRSARHQFRFVGLDIALRCRNAHQRRPVACPADEHAGVCRRGGKAKSRVAR